MYRVKQKAKAPKTTHSVAYSKFKGKKKLHSGGAKLVNYTLGGKEKLSAEHAYQSFENATTTQLKSDNSVLRRPV